MNEKIDVPSKLKPFDKKKKNNYGVIFLLQNTLHE